jgi:hypothetical protein
MYIRILFRHVTTGYKNKLGLATTETQLYSYDINFSHILDIDNLYCEICNYLEITPKYYRKSNIRTNLNTRLLLRVFNYFLQKCFCHRSH